MIPGEIITAGGEIEINAGAVRTRLEVANTGDRPIQVGSHYHFFETNDALRGGHRCPLRARPTARSDVGALWRRPRGLWISRQGDGKAVNCVIRMKTKPRTYHGSS
jgi:hypothetical protein